MQLSVGLHAQIVVLEEWNLQLRLAPGMKASYSTIPISI